MSRTEGSAVPGLSTAMKTSQEECAGEDNEISLKDYTGEDIDKFRMREAVIRFDELLAESNLISTNRSNSSTIKEEGDLLAQDIFNYVTATKGEKTFVTIHELVLHSERIPNDGFEDVPDEINYSGSEKDKNDDSDYEPEEKKTRTGDLIPLSYKIKVVNLVRRNPNWGLKTIQSKGGSRLKRLDYLPRWIENIKSGGTARDKWDTVDTWTYDRFVEARENMQQVTTRDLQQWALAAASQFVDLNFKAGRTWVNNFKRKHRIGQRKVTKFVSEIETLSMETILEAAADFRILTRELIAQYDPDFVINTDQTECRYQATIERTVSNKVTHSYTVQYTLTLSGKLAPHIFVCLQEVTGTFGPQVQKSIDQYSAKYPSVVITSSHSGKLTTHLYEKFLQQILKPYVKQQKFLLLIDSWDGQAIADTYEEIFRDSHNRPSCRLKVIPPKCTRLVQPCEVYFYRQVKNFIKRLQKCEYLVETNTEINSREDCIKIHAIVHHQLSSPIFQPMLHYAWFAAKLCDDRDIFMNVNQVCFSADMLQKPCKCKNTSFIQCAQCRETFCFPCFYTEYHCGSCETVA